MDIEGVLNGGDLPVVVDGRFTGEIHAEKVTLGEYGLFVGKLFAVHVEIAGQFNGELVCDTLREQREKLMVQPPTHCQLIWG